MNSQLSKIALVGEIERRTILKIFDFHFAGNLETKVFKKNFNSNELNPAYVFMISLWLECFYFKKFKTKVCRKHPKINEIAIDI